ncbi:winged helix-turn-helix transcriptional regulator [Georhizobium sp. MAB10]|uniref:winged helix-turn-helix transcriptional regulator n=1 Tax=Georhizobium sp. MAB10 TaxID=3028319 RepID=UPI00385582C9
MTEHAGYGQFCPVAMAAEILCSRWTVLIVRELICGTTRFNDLRRGVPRMSPALLSKRLKELEQAGVIEAIRRNDGTASEYHLTRAGRDLEPLVMGLGIWGQRWVESRLSLKNLDPSLLMWDMRRHLNPQPLPPRRCMIQFLYPELPTNRQSWWLVVDRGHVDLCNFDPGFDLDLLVTGELRSMTAVWMGLAPIRSEIDAGRLVVDGDPVIAKAMQQWLGLSPFAPHARQAS